MKKAYIGIGSNLGDSRRNCDEATDRLGRIPESEIISRSPLYESEPVGVDGQEWYTNGVVSLSTDLSAQDLIKNLLAIEKEMGRVRKKRWEARIIDLDILLFGEDIIHEENLVVPHPLMHERLFVIYPMVDLVPDLIHPSLGKTMAELLLTLPRDKKVLRLSEVP